MKLIKLLFAAFFMMLIVIACEKDEEEPIIDPCDSTSYTYDNDISAIINSNCNVTGCHDGAVGSMRQPMTNYAEFKKLVDAGGVRARAIDNKTMPPNGPLSQELRDMLDCWMKDGAPK